MKSSKKTMLAIAVTLLLAAALFVGAAAAADVNGDNSGAADENGQQTVTDPVDPAADDVAQLVNASGTTYYKTFADAYAALTKGDNAAKPETPEVITLLKSTTTGGFGLDADKNMNYVVDLSGFTLTVQAPGVGSTGYSTQGIRLTSGSDAVFKNGTIDVPANNLSDGVTNPIKMLIHNYGKMTLGDVTVDGTNVLQAKSGGQPCATYTIAAGYVSNQDGLVIKGSTKVIAPNNTTLEADQPRIALEAATTGTTSIVADSDKIPTIQGDIESAATTNFIISAGSFTDLASAVKYAADNATITLADNVTGPGIKIGETSDSAPERTITIDLGGFTYTIDGAKAIGSGDGHLTQGIRIGNKETVTIQNGKLDITNNDRSEGQRVVWLINNYGNLTLGNDVVIDGSQVSKYATETPENVNAVVFSNTGSVNVTENASIKAPTGVPALYVGWFKDYPEKGKPSGTICAKGTDATIDTTGTIDGAVAFKLYYSTYGEEFENGPKLAITAGNFKGSLDVATDSDFQKYAKSTGIKISGGSFTDPTVAQYVQSGKSISVKLDKNYGTEAAGCHVTIPSQGATVTLDLNGFTINGGTTGTDAGKETIKIETYGNLTIKDSVGTGVIKRADVHTQAQKSERPANWYYVIDNQGGTLIIEGGTIENDAGVAETTETEFHAGASLIRNGHILTIKDGTLKQPYFNVIKNEKGTVTIDNGTLECKEASYAILTYDNLEINGGKITGPIGIMGYPGTSAEALANNAPELNSSLSNTVNAAASGKATITGGIFEKGDSRVNPGISLIAYEGYTEKKLSAEIIGGKFGEGYGFKIGKGTTETGVTEEADVGTIHLTGGVFTTKPEDKYIAESYQWDADANAVVKPKEIADDHTFTPDPEEKVIPGTGEITAALEKIENLPTEAKKVTYTGSIVTADGQKFAEQTFVSIDVSIYDNDKNKIHTTLSEPVIVTFTIADPGIDLSKLAVYHKKSNGDWEKLDAEIEYESPGIQGSAVLITAKTYSFSPFVVVELKQQSKPSSSGSTSQGSSTWLTEPTAQPTAQPTPTATPGPVETPGVKPVTPTETPAKTPAPFVGILAGLGAAAAVFGLRRK